MTSNLRRAQPRGWRPPPKATPPPRSVLLDEVLRLEAELKEVQQPHAQIAASEAAREAEGRFTLVLLEKVSRLEVELKQVQRLLVAIGDAAEETVNDEDPI